MNSRSIDPEKLIGGFFHSSDYQSKSFPQSFPIPPAPFGPYFLEQQIGEGGQGVVYRARQVAMDRWVAIKALKCVSSTTAADRFVRETQIMGRLTHPNLVRTLDAGVVAGVPYLVLDWIEGETLLDRLERGPLKSAEIRVLFLKLALALHYGHEEGVLHRDVKPSNVLLSSTGEPFLTDYGVAKFLDASPATDSDRSRNLTRTGAFVGTLDCAAPEQIRGQRIDARSDVYGLGVTLYAALAGRPPFRASNQIQLLQAIEEETPTLPLGVDANLARICLRCLEKEPKARFATAYDVALALGQAGEHPGWRPRRSHLLLGVSLLVGLGLGVVLVAGKNTDRNGEWGQAARQTTPVGEQRTPKGPEVETDFVESAPPRSIDFEWGGVVGVGTAVPEAPSPSPSPKKGSQVPQKGDTPADSAEEGYRRFKAQAFTSAYRAFERSASAGSALGMLGLGVLYATGRGISQDLTVAAQWFRRSALKGNGDAMARLGALYRDGLGVDQDFAVAYTWLQRGVEANSSVAMRELGVSYAKGWGVPRDTAKAIALFRQGAELGNSRCMANLGDMYLKGVDGYPKDVAKARAWYEKGVQVGGARSMAKLGYLYLYGIGVEQDRGRALRLFSKGATHGSPLAMGNLGLVYVEWGDYTSALKWFEKAATLNDANAMNSLGNAYLRGQGVRQNLKLAAQWFLKSARLKNVDAIVNLGAMYAHGVGVERNAQKALELYRKGAAAGSGAAMHKLGKMYERGHGVKIDLRQAKVWYRKAQKAGYSPAQFRPLSKVVPSNGR